MGASSTHQALKDVGLISVSGARPLGVDIEGLDAKLDPALLQSALSGEERELFGVLSRSERLLFVLTAWTRKEALVKAVGVGMAVTPQRFSSFTARVGPIEDPRPHSNARMRVEDLEAPGGFVAAICAEGDDPIRVVDCEYPGSYLSRP